MEYSTATDQECLDAFMTLSRVEGIVPALESSHAVAWAIREASKRPKETMIVVNLSGRGDKDSDYVAENLSFKLNILKERPISKGRFLFYRLNFTLLKSSLFLN